MVNPNIFRTYDIRGIAEDDLTDNVVYHLGRAYATYINNDGLNDIVIARDVRLSSERIRDALIKGLLDSGINVTDVGTVPTPVLYFSIFHLNKHGGIMITGSHNPKEYNGFKILKEKATIYGEEIQTLKKIINAGNYTKGKGSVQEYSIMDEYKQDVLSRINIKEKLDIVIDPGNGTCAGIADDILRRAGCSVECINCEPDGTFPAHLPDPTIPEYMEQLKNRVIEKGAKLGIGYDGDGDRLGVIDDEGTIVWGDKLLGIYSKEVLKKFPGAPIVFEVKCSLGLVEYISSLGGNPYMWKTGHSLIKAKMKEINSPLAGEMSGHMFFKDNYYGYDDAIFASLRLIQLLSNDKRPLSSIVNEIPSYFSTPEIRVDSTDEDKFNIVEKIKNFYKKKGYNIIDIDGVRVNFGDGWGLVRASNTQPVLVLRFEAKSEERLKEIQEEIMGKL
ncbi:phosphomannomutase/phosphoglucomutase [candidate division WOR-3 bacterium]|nr:phosphomannomutase/phosphoglucomutase [candidate division WOR-3 bacterium]